MLKKMIEPFKLLLGLLIADALLCLLYFWAAMLSYSLWLSDTVFSTWPIMIRTVEVHFHGPNILVLFVIGLFSPLITFLPFILFRIFVRKLPLLIKYGLCIIWLGEIFALGFFIPRLWLF